jgi:hypothetical protein
MPFASTRTLRWAKCGRAGYTVSRRRDLHFIFMSTSVIIMCSRLTVPCVARPVPNHALNCCKPIAPWSSSPVAQLTNIQKHPTSRLDAVAILRIGRLLPCAICQLLLHSQPLSGHFRCSLSLSIRLLEIPTIGASHNCGPGEISGLNPGESPVHPGSLCLGERRI